MVSSPIRLLILALLGLMVMGTFHGPGFAAVTAVASPNTQALELSQDSRLLVPWQHVEYFVANKSISNHQVLWGLDQSQWQSLPSKIINLGSNPGPVWIRFSVTNQSGEPLERLLELRWVHLSEVDYYLVREPTPDNPAEKMEHYPAGLKRPVSSYYRDSPSYLFPLQLAANETAEIYIRAKTSFRAFLPLFLWEPKAFEKAQKTKSIVYCLAFGVLAAMVVYNLCLYLFTRDRLFLLYSFYGINIVFFELAQSGIGNYLVWGHSDWMRQNGYSVSIYSSFLAGTLFFRDSVGLVQERGWPLKVNNVLVVFWSFGLAVELLGLHILREVAGALAAAAVIAIWVSALALSLRGNVAARYFALAWTFMTIFTCINILMMEGVMPYSNTSYYGQLFGFVCEMLLLSFALAHRVNLMRQKMEHAQQRALALQRAVTLEREKRIDAQDQLLQLQKASTAALELEVEERTQALQVTMEDLQRVNQTLSTLSITDSLTGIHNRHFFDQILVNELARSLSSGCPLSLILVDVDHFKRFNDRYGHLAGDDCLKLVARTLRNSVGRDSDCVARFGGEEFVILLPQTSELQAYGLAEKIRMDIANLVLTVQGERVRISASLGVAGRVATDTDSEKSLIAAADKALYDAKSNGRNRCVSAQLAVS